MPFPIASSRTSSTLLAPPLRSDQCRGAVQGWVECNSEHHGDFRLLHDPCLQLHGVGLAHPIEVVLKLIQSKLV